MAGIVPFRQAGEVVLFALAAAEINPRLLLAVESKQILKFKRGLMAAFALLRRLRERRWSNSVH